MNQTKPSYRILRSARKTAVIQIRNGEVIVRGPLTMTDAWAANFVLQHEGWIGKHLAQAQAEKAAAPDPVPLTAEELRNLAHRAQQVIPERVRYFAPLVGVTYGRITIRNQRTRWGSCSSKGNLNFNCLLLLAPPEVLDSVVVHELCHRKEMNHSPRFYDQVRRVLPDYDRRHAWLREHGNELLRRIPV